MGVAAPNHTTPLATQTKYAMRAPGKSQIIRAHFTRAHAHDRQRPASGTQTDRLTPTDMSSLPSPSTGAGGLDEAGSLQVDVQREQSQRPQNLEYEMVGRDYFLALVEELQELRRQSSTHSAELSRLRLSNQNRISLQIEHHQNETMELETALVRPSPCVKSRCPFSVRWAKFCSPITG